MKRSDMVKHIQKEMRKFMFEPSYYEADQHLRSLEELGMKPPALSNNMRQALMHVYYMGYTFYQWEEDFFKDKKAVEAFEKILERKAKKESK